MAKQGGRKREEPTLRQWRVGLRVGPEPARAAALELTESKAQAPLPPLTDSELARANSDPAYATNLGPPAGPASAPPCGQTPGSGNKVDKDGSAARLRHRGGRLGLWFAGSDESGKGGRFSCAGDDPHQEITSRLAWQPTHNRYLQRLFPTESFEKKPC